MLKNVSVFRQSYIILFFKLLSLEIFFAVFYLIVRIPKTVIFDGRFAVSDLGQLYNMGTFYFLILFFIKIILSLYLVLLWVSEEYEINEGIIFHRRGVFRKTEDSYSLKNLGSFTIYQSFLGRLFNYGDIKVFSPVLKQDFHLVAIHDPKRIAESLEDDISGSGDKNRIIPRRN